jgi:hypothetical protein
MPQDHDEFIQWSELAEYPDKSAAEVDAGYLRSEGIPATVIVIDNFPGHGRSRIRVDSSQVDRARWLLKFPPVSEAELEYLATGDLPKPNSAE